MLGDFPHAEDAYTEAVSLSRRLRDSLLKADAVIGLGLSKRAVGKWKEALRLLSKAKKTYEKESDNKGAAFASWAEGGAYRIKGDIENSIRFFRAALRMYGFRKSDIPLNAEDRRAIGYCLCGLGGVLRVAGRFKDSMQYYTSANTLLSSLKDRFGTAYSHCGIGNAFRMEGNYDMALKHFKRAEAMYKRIGDIVSYSYTIWSMAMTYIMTARLRMAEKCLYRATANFRKTGDVRGLIYCWLCSGELLFLKGDSKGAIKLLRRALDDSRKYNFKIEACHSAALLDYMNTGKANNACYRGIGSRLRLRAIPFNIP
ncbi:MAG: tetratricopeptide repeat protein [Thermodesulfovibrionales bacterium]